MDSFPAFYPLAGKRVVIAGDDAAAEAKARLFAGSPAEIVRLKGDGAFDPEGYAGADLIFVASFDADFRERAIAAARTAGAPLNVVDAPAFCDFFTPAIVDRGALVVAVGASGAAPLLASMLRADLERAIPAGAGRMAALLGERRPAIRAAYPKLDERRTFLRAVLGGPAAAAADRGDMAEAGRQLDRALAGETAAIGSIAFIVSPAAPDLLSLRAARALAGADVIVASPADESLVARHGRREAERWLVGCSSVEQLAARALAGGHVAVVGALPDSRAVADLGRRFAVDVLHPAPTA
ncbi:MAG: bifunctional precorrin-2 dehydrogenase/sirohydrochlorin ferrochelatase [Caulobacteraceae bacterium]